MLEEIIDRPPELGQLRHSASEIFGFQQRITGLSGFRQRRGQRVLLGLGQLFAIDGVAMVSAILFLLNRDDLGGSAISNQQIGAVIRAEESLQRPRPLT